MHRTASVSPSHREEARVRLRSIHVLRDLPDDALDQVAPFFHQTHYVKDSIIFYERDLPSEMGSKIYFVIEGLVKLVKYSAEGEGTIVRLAGEGEFFGVTSALTGKPMPFSAETLADTLVLYIDRAHLLQLVEKFPKVALGMVVQLGEALWFNYETHNQVVKKADIRVAKIILHHMERDGYRETPAGRLLNIHLNHDYIASMTGIAYEESVRIVSRLKKACGCLQYLRGGKIIISDVAKLKEIAQEDDCI